MDREQVELLEAEIAAAIADLLRKHARAGLPEQRILHLMAKAAVAVLEAFEVPEQKAKRRGG